MHFIPCIVNPQTFCEWWQITANQNGDTHQHLLRGEESHLSGIVHLPGRVIFILRVPQRNGPASASRHLGRLIGHAMRSFPQLPS